MKNEGSERKSDNLWIYLPKMKHIEGLNVSRSSLIRVPSDRERMVLLASLWKKSSYCIVQFEIFDLLHVYLHLGRNFFSFHHIFR